MEQNRLTLERRRLAAARLLQNGIPQAEVARRVGVSRASVHRWNAMMAKNGFSGLASKGPPGPRMEITSQEWQNFVRLSYADPRVFGFRSPVWTLSQLVKTASYFWPAWDQRTPRHVELLMLRGFGGVQRLLHGEEARKESRFAWWPPVLFVFRWNNRIRASVNWMKAGERQPSGRYADLVFISQMLGLERPFEFNEFMIDFGPNGIIGKFGDIFALLPGSELDAERIVDRAKCLKSFVKKCEITTLQREGSGMKAWKMSRNEIGRIGVECWRDAADLAVEMLDEISTDVELILEKRKNSFRLNGLPAIIPPGSLETYAELSRMAMNVHHRTVQLSDFDD